MVLATSFLIALGTIAPSFTLPDVTTGEMVSSEDFAGKKAMLVMFICNHCPFVVHINEGLAEFANDYTDKDIAIVAISPNDIEAYPADSPENLKKQAEKYGFTFPYLFDESQEVALAYSARCTPEFFLFDAERKLVYRGQFDSSRPRSDVPVTGEDLRAAVDAVLAGEEVSEDQTPSVGCSIKWKPGNAPE